MRRRIGPDRHPDGRYARPLRSAHGPRPRLVPGLPRRRAHGRRHARPVRPRPGHLHLPCRPRAVAAAAGLGDRARVAGCAARRAPARPRPGRWRWLLPYMPRYFEHLDLSGYELVLSSSHACAAGVRTPGRASRLLLPHPDALRVDAGGRAEPGEGVQGRRPAGVRGRLRRWDREASRRPDFYVANSTAVAERIRNFYERDAVVVPPPVAVGDFPDDVPRDPRASSGFTAWSPTSVRSRWPRPSGGCPSCG